jgi:hypothetical protein
MNPNVPFHYRLSCTVQEACQATGASRSTIWRLIAARELETIALSVTPASAKATRKNGRRLILVPSLLRRFGITPPAAEPRQRVPDQHSAA